jgi:hypothetical protein
MSEEKINVYIEIGDNLKSVMEKAINDADTYSDPDGTGQLFSSIFSGIKNLIVEYIKAKKEKEIILTCPTLNPPKETQTKE